MPRIKEDFLQSVFYLYPSEHEAEEGINIGGSGFLVSIDSDRIKGGHFIYAVTNRHVLASADVGRFNTKDGKTHIERLDRGLWTKSKTDDLAIRPLVLDPQIFSHRTVPIDLIITKMKADELEIGMGDHIFMVGRFINHEGVQRNAPIARFGTISQMPAEAISYMLEGRRHDQISIIADVRSIGGYSGSPVFLNELGFISRPSGISIDKHWLIGIDWGHIKMWSPVCGPNEEPIGVSQVNINSGMAGLVPGWCLWEMLMDDELVRQRTEAEEKHISANKPLSAAVDIALPGPAATGEKLT